MLVHQEKRTGKLTFCNYPPNMNKMCYKCRCLLLLVCCMISFQLSAQLSININAPRQVALNSYFQVEYTINTAGASQIQSPKVNDFKILNAPSKSVFNSVSIINGKKQSSSTTTYTIVLQPLKKGKCTIPSVTINVGGKKVKSSSVVIEVVDGGGQSSSANTSAPSGQASAQASQRTSSRDLFIRTSVDKKEVYENEPILLSYRFYTKRDLQNIAPERKPDFSGMFAQEVPISDIFVEHERVGGVPYFTATHLQYLVFPNKPGKIKIPGVTFDCVAALDPIEAFFGGGGVVKCPSPDVEISVKPLPQPQPDNFKGVVGLMSISGALLTDSVRSNEVCTYRVILKGSGNLKMISAPELKLPDGFDKYSPKVVDDLQTSANGVQGEVVYEYTFVPRSPGEYQIPPVELVYFDLGTKNYKTICTSAISLKVSKGSKSDEEYLREKKLLVSDIRGIHTDDINDAKWINRTHWSTFLVAYLLLLLVAWGAVRVYNKYSDVKSDVQGRRSSKAGRMAVKRMRQAQILMNGNDEKEFYAEVIRALYGYLSDKFGVGMSSLNREYISTTLLCDTDEAIKASFINIIEECEIAQYSASLSALPKQQIYQNAVEAIVSMEECLKKS